MVRDQSPTDYKVELGEALAALRVRAGMERRDAATRLTCSVSKVRTIELGEVAVRAPELRDLLDLYGVSGSERADIEHLGEEARRRRPRTDWGSAIPDRLRKFFNTEETAIAIEAYQPWLVHGMAQTEPYARAVLETNSSFRPQDIERLVRARMARQERLYGAHPPVLTLVIDESALTRPVGGSAVMGDQLSHLIDMARDKIAHVRAIPTAVGAHAGSGVPFVILTPSGDRKKTVHAETFTDGLLVDESRRVERYETAMKEMLALALSPGDTIDLLDTVRRQLRLHEEESDDPKPERSDLAQEPPER